MGVHAMTDELFTSQLLQRLQGKSKEKGPLSSLQDYMMLVRICHALNMPCFQSLIFMTWTGQVIEDLDDANG
jgi:hypothetical protein